MSEQVALHASLCHTCTFWSFGTAVCHGLREELLHYSTSFRPPAAAIAACFCHGGQCGMRTARVSGVGMQVIVVIVDTAGRWDVQDPGKGTRSAATAQ
jgi:hypothetical protein